MTLEDKADHCFAASTHTSSSSSPAIVEGSQPAGVPPFSSPPPPPPPPPPKPRPIFPPKYISSPPRSTPDSLAGFVRRRSILLAEETARATSRKLAGEESRAQDSSRHGFASHSITRNLSGFGPPPAPGPEPLLALAPIASPTDAEASGAPAGALGKRSTAADKRPTQPLGSPLKKPRLVAPGSLSLPAIPRTAAELTSAARDLVSPLFFSNSKDNKSRMTRPPGFATSEVAASMMGDTENPDGVTTLRLPKGVTTASPARSSGTPGSWSSTELSSLSRSPDGWPQPSTIQLIQGIGVIELLEQDDRPTFIIDLNEPANFGQGPLHIIFANASLRSASGVLELLHLDTAESTQDADFARFKAWAVTLVRERVSNDINATPSAAYAGLNWTWSTVRRRFRIIRGNGNTTESNTPTPPRPAAPPPWLLEQKATGPWTTNREPLHVRERGDYFGPVSDSHVRSHSEPRSRAESVADTVILPLDDLALATPFTPQLQTTFDFTRIPSDDPSLSPHHRFVRSVDWASTSLGPVEGWPSDLRIMANMVMGSPHPAALYWGPDYVALYNEAYISLAGKKHPNLMGARYRDAWPEIWGELAPVFDAAWKEGSATMKHDDDLFITRHGFLEETFFNWAIIPLVGGDGTVVALYNPAFENTRRKIGERRMLTLREVGVKISQARDVKDFWSQLQKGLEYNELDVPFALIYSVSEDSESESSSMASGSLSHPPQIILEGSIGVPDGHPCAVSSIDLKSSDEGFANYMRESMANAAVPIILSVEDGTFPTDLVQGLEWKGFGDPCRTIVIFPVHPTTAGDTIVGFIVLGINPRRRYDEDYKLFVNLLSRQLATSMASVVLFDEEIKRGQRAARLAALDRQELSMQLHLRTQEAVKSEYRFTRMAEFGPVGLFIADGQGHINYCNEMWYKISGHERGTNTLDAWMQTIRDEDRASVENIWSRIVEDKRPVTHEFRFKGLKRLIDGHSVDIWTLMSAYPEKDEYGELKSIFGCLTDISQQKWAEDFQKQRRDEAVELKRQQENFIDITSHEMRNPLSAILQCADEISSGLNQYLQEGNTEVAQTAGSLKLLVESCVEAANTISLCASHQKRIVDDILTLSKLDSNLLLVTPVDVQPVMVVQNVLKMFDTELNTNDIQGEFHVDESYRDLDIDWVKLDPSRLRQVLINLMTNAIKFTQGRPTRSIVISLGASKEVMREGRLSYIPPRHPDQDDLTDQEDWGDGEKIHLHLAVTDTGPGLDDDEKKILFQRFSQASPRTHVQYGGSGLGLFICRILTELQGGQIGVLSEKGVGSTFAFYVKSRKSNHPQVDLSAAAPTPRPSPSRQIQSAATSVQEKQEPQFEPMQLLDAPVLAPPLPIPSRKPPNNNNGKSMDILIVEDNLVNQRVLQRQLQLSGNNTYVANHGLEALFKLRRSRFWNDSVELDHIPQWLLPSETPSEDTDHDMEGNDKNISVILMDLEMPVMDGMSCTREIRRLEGRGVITQHIPIIAVTAYARPEQIENAKAAGVDDVISKPFRIPELIPKIEELVAKYGTMVISS